MTITWWFDKWWFLWLGILIEYRLRLHSRSGNLWDSASDVVKQSFHTHFFGGCNSISYYDNDGCDSVSLGSQSRKDFGWPRCVGWQACYQRLVVSEYRPCFFVSCRRYLSAALSTIFPAIWAFGTKNHVLESNNSTIMSATVFYERGLVCRSQILYRHDCVIWFRARLFRQRGTMQFEAIIQVKIFGSNESSDVDSTDS